MLPFFAVSQQNDAAFPCSETAERRLPFKVVIQQNECLRLNAVNQQKDVVFDGTMTWAPFVQQTIAMVRDHRHNYKRGPGCYVDEEGTTYERCGRLNPKP